MHSLKVYLPFVVIALVAFTPRAALAQSGASGAGGSSSSAAFVNDDQVKQCIKDCETKTQASAPALEKCKAELDSCKKVRDEDWPAAYGKLVDHIKLHCPQCAVERLNVPGDPTPVAKPPKPPAVEPPKPLPPPKAETPFVLCTGGAVKSKSGHGCECKDGFPARELDDNEGRGWKEAKCTFTTEDVRRLLVPFNEHFEGVCKPGVEGRSKDAQAACDETGDNVNELMAWYNSLVQGGKALTKESWVVVYDKVTGLDKRLDDIEARLRKLEAGQNEICPEIPGKPEATLKERCAYARKRYLEKPTGPFKGGIDWEVGVYGGYLHRPGAAFDTSSVAGVLGLTGWFNQSHGFRVRGLAGYAAHPDTPRLYTGAEAAYRLVLDESRSTILALGIQGTFEPASRGNEASNFVGKASVQFRLALHFFLEPEVAVGGSQVVQYAPDGSGERRLTGWGFVLQPGVSLGAVF